tara:strand:+ start:104 stop:493 length:390 start_codon:yes stop_codon:yes gene_type:complete
MKILKELSRKEFRSKFSAKEFCLTFLSEVKWPDDFCCHKCNNKNYSKGKKVQRLEIISKWTLYFLDNISILPQKLDDKYDVFKTKGGYLNERQKEIQKFIDKNQPVKISDISKSLKNITIHRLKKIYSI